VLRKLIDTLQADGKIPSEFLSKTQVLGLARIAKKFLDIYDLVTRSFGLIQVALKLILGFVNLTM